MHAPVGCAPAQTTGTPGPRWPNPPYAMVSKAVPLRYEQQQKERQPTQQECRCSASLVSRLITAALNDLPPPTCPRLPLFITEAPLPCQVAKPGVGVEKLSFRL